MTVKDLVAARIYSSEDEAMVDAMRHLLRARPDVRAQLAAHRYQTQEISLARAASEAGVSWAQMRDILLERGIEPRLGPEDLFQAEAEVAAVRSYLSSHR